MIRFLRRHAVLSLAFAVALAVTLMFLVRFAVSTVMWADPARHEQPIAGWMTPRYVARSWHVPPEVVAAALGLEPDGIGRRTTLEEIAAAQGRSLEELRQALEAALRDARGEPDG